jgi:hypothetical protein
MYIHSKYVFLF